MSFGNREGIGRFGMGMKTAALSMSPVMDLYSWQEPGAFYKMTLDVEDIGDSRANSVNLPDPTLVTALPKDVSRLFAIVLCPSPPPAFRCRSAIGHQDLGASRSGNSTSS